MKMVDRLLTILTVIVIVVFSGVAIYNRFRAHARRDNSSVDGPVLLEAIGNHNHATLVLVLAKGCHWCRASAPLYRALLANSTTGGRDFVAVMPNTDSNVREYLDTLGLEFPTILQEDFARLGVVGTPTMVLVDSANRIKSIWVGKLTDIQEHDALALLERVGFIDKGGLLRISQSLQASEVSGAYATDDGQSYTTAPTEPARPATSDISDTDFAKAYSKASDIAVVDTRKRIDYFKGHIRHSLNIPFDELQARAVHELPTWQPVFVYCPFRTDYKQNELSDPCFVAVTGLREVGFSQAMTIGNSTLKMLGEAGVPIEGSLDESGH